ncbi:hypothetical protein AB0B45_49830 [Nonomuraea sp. NPDC049152]|uniref:hypothetical protein n=1 Tax=Nonomuraea sp. NPDC049152 TaxID=3154350 RepID=UPI0033EE3878
MSEPKENIGPLAVDSLLAAARAELRRLSPAEAAVAVARGARLVDTRPPFHRAADGEIPGAIVIERNHLEWRLDPASLARIPEATCRDAGITWDELAPPLRVARRPGRRCRARRPGGGRTGRR